MSQAQRKILCKLCAEYNAEMISSASIRPAQTAYAVSSSAPNNATRHCVQCCRWARAVLINCSTRNDSDSPVPLCPSCAQALQAAKGLKLQVTFPTWLSPRRNRPPKVSVLSNPVGKNSSHCKILPDAIRFYLRSSPSRSRVAELPWMELYFRICSGGSMSRAVPCGMPSSRWECIGLRALVCGLQTPSASSQGLYIGERHTPSRTPEL